MNSDISLNPPSKWAVSIYSGIDKKGQASPFSKPQNQQQKPKPKPTPAIPYEPKGKAKYASFSTNLRARGPYISDVELALTGISSSDQITIDFERVLSLRKGDLAMIQKEVFRCRANIPHLEHIPLVLKRLECIDRRIYDLKVHESDLFMKYRSHPNFISLYSYWPEPSTNRYAFKNLVQLYEEGSYGDMLETLMMNPVAPSPRIVLKYMCDIAKALSSIHASNVIHGAVSPSNIYICKGNEAKLGEFKKVELDAMRQTHQLSSKILVGQAIPKSLIYWAPELFTLDKYDTMVDIWALGITFFQVVTGEHPFTVTNEEHFKTEVTQGKVRWNVIKGYPIIGYLLQNLLKVNPKERWIANQVLYYCYDFFAVEIQSAWRRFHCRREFKRISLALVKIQAHIRGFLTKIHYQRDRIIAKEKAALAIQKKFRSHDVSRNYRLARKALTRCQANVLTRQMRRAFLKMKIDVIMGQAFIRRFLAMNWYTQLKKQRYDLENHLQNINSMIEKYNRDAQQFQDQFSTKKVGGPLKQIGKDGQPDRSSFRGNPQLARQYEDLLEEKKEIEMRLARKPLAKKTNQDSGPIENNNMSYQQLNNEHNPKRFAELQSQSRHLNIKLQHSYSYNQWDAVHDSSNMAENVLKDNDSIYKDLNPVLDFTLNQGTLCFISEVRIFSGEPSPGDIQIFISDALDRWDFLMTFRCSRDPIQRILFKEETFAKYLRLKCMDNIRGGNVCSIRYIQVFGVPYHLYGERR